MTTETPPVDRPDAPQFTVAALPDTQHYSAGNPAAFEIQTRWLAERRDAENVAFVVHEGDVVNTPDPEQFERAERAIGHLEDDDVPFLLATGNHDHDDISTRDASTFEEYFPEARFSDRPWWGDSYDGTAYNAYASFEALGEPYLVLSLEPFPREAVVEWAEEVLAAHPDRRALVVTHGYLYRDGTPMDTDDHWDRTVYDLAGHNGDELWDRFLDREANLQAVFCGHVLCDGAGGAVGTRTNDHGTPVHGLLTNYQDLEDGGRGYLRLVRFFPAADAITVETYSPLLGGYHEDPAHHYRIDDAF
jgi:broad specificity phosphatase PhoE